MPPKQAASQPVSGPGARRAAAVLLSLGPELASEIFKNLGESEIRRIAVGARDLKGGKQEEVMIAVEAFVETFDRPGDPMAGEAFLRDVAEKALGSETAKRVFEDALPGLSPEEVLAELFQNDAETLAMVLSRESPQTVALVLSAVDRGAAMSVMDRLPLELRPQILRRMATIDSVTPEVLREVSQALSNEIRAGAGSGGMRKLGGRATTIEILRRSSADEQTAVLAEIERVDAELAAQLRSKLFTFEDIALLSDRDIQTLLKEIDSKRLGQALKGASQEIKQKFLKNMATRAAMSFEEDLAMLGAVRLSVVEEAQTEISKLVLGLAEQEKVTIVNPADQML